MPSQAVKWVIMIASAFVVSGCTGGKMEGKKTNFQALSEVPASKWQQLSSKIIYFGHQSVGYNILDGIKDILKEHPGIKLNIIEIADPDENGAFMHSSMGRNTEPASKIREFEKILTSDIGHRIDIALMKFCYVDVVAGSNPIEIFENYKQTVQRIKDNNEAVQIIHFTVPLTRLQTGPKAWVKRIIGQPTYGVEDNIKRYEYNQMVIGQFAGKDPIFDLSEIESTKPNGERVYFEQKGKHYFSLSPEYTYDWGHLNQMGRKKAAEQLLLLLASEI